MDSEPIKKPVSQPAHLLVPPQPKPTRRLRLLAYLSPHNKGDVLDERIVQNAALLVEKKLAEWVEPEGS